jgi:hypothetical protein
VKGTRVDAGHATNEAAAVVDAFWDLYAARTRS